jgi:hypothetical protein
MSQSRNTSHQFGSIHVVNTSTLNKIRLTRSSAAQATSITTGVTLNSAAGLITTFTGGNVSTSGNVYFPVSNTDVKADSIILTNVVSYTSGIPHVVVDSVAEGSFTIYLYNLSNDSSISHPVTIGYTVL